MKAIVLVCLVLLLAATGARAAEIHGKWGLGAGVSNSGAQVSLIRGKSERSAWLFDFSVDQNGGNADIGGFFPPLHLEQNVWTFQIGPGYRRFLRPNERFTPYWDIGVSATYARFHSDATLGSATLNATQTMPGVAGQLAFGLEFFVRPHLSVAGHTNVVRLAWEHTSLKIEPVSIPGPSGNLYSTGHALSSQVGVRPEIFVRGYW